VQSIKAALLLFWLSLSRTAAREASTTTTTMAVQGSALSSSLDDQPPQPHRSFVMMNGGSSFFYPIHEGWLDACAKLPNVTCEHYYENKTWFYEAGYTREVDILPCVPLIREFIARGVDGIAAKCNIEHEIFQEAADAGIPLVAFQGNYDAVPINTYVGTNNDYLGRTLARLLKQLRPEGGTFVCAYNGQSSYARTVGFLEEIKTDNNREDKGHWHPAELNFTFTKLGSNNTELLVTLDLIAAHNPTAILFMYQTPMRHPNYTQFVDRHRARNISLLGTQGDDEQLAFMARRYVDGLVGQTTYDMGKLSAETLWRIVTQGADSGIPKKINTKLINYNLVPNELSPLQVDQSLLGNLKYIGNACFTAVAFVAISCTLWTLNHRKGTVVRASQPFFLVMTAAGVIIMASALIPLSMDDDGQDIGETRAKGICMSIPWLIFVGFAVTFSALFSKTWRVNRFFHSASSHARIQCSETDVLMPFGIMLTLNIAVLTVWTLVDPLTYIRQYEDGTDLYNRSLASNGTCQSDNGAAFLAPLGVCK
jgi:ABC-type sugar transport system substrate-binding protein